MTGNIIKVLASSILSFSLVFVGSTTMAATQSAKIVGTSVNIRKAPNTSASIIKRVSDSRVSVLEKSGGWYKISYDGKTGWVNGEYIKVLKTNGSINANGVNFRSSAGTNGTIISSLKRGTSVEILDTNNNWHKVKVGSKVGYVATKFITSSANSRKSSRSTDAAAFASSDDSTTSKVVAYAKEFLGVKYVYGGMSPSGFDCSGFVGYVYKHFGVHLNRTAEDMYSNGIKVSKSALRAGDILFFSSSSGVINHTGVYLGDDKFIHASSSHREIRIQSLSEYTGNYAGAKRVI